MMRSHLPEDFPRRGLILDLAALAEHPAVERVWLFGSRARGDAFERSDIDFAIEAPKMDRGDWVRLKLDFEDEALAIDGTIQRLSSRSNSSGRPCNMCWPTRV